MVYRNYGSYVLKNEFTPASYTADNHNNDSIQVARKNLTSTIQLQEGFIIETQTTYDFVDWFKVTTPDDGQLSFSVACESTLQVDNLQLFDKDTATLILSGSYGVSASISYPNLTPGTYYIRVPIYRIWFLYTQKPFYPA